jgi:REP element-mobilizing transposase RayT
MGRSRYKSLQDDAPHFLTCTLLNWIPLFTRPDTVEIVLDAIRHRQQHLGWRVYGFVVLENHLHIILQTARLREELMRFKSFTARQLLDYLEAHRIARLLDQLAWFKKKHKRDRQYWLWEEGSHPQMLVNARVLRQKLEYIHNNPVKRGYVDRGEHWRYSSARIYAGERGLLDIYTEWWRG